MTPDERGHVSSFTPMLAFPPGRVCELQLLCCGFSRGSQELFVKSQHLGLPAAAVPCRLVGAEKRTLSVWEDSEQISSAEVQ